MATPRQEVIRYAKTEKLKVSTSGGVPMLSNADGQWYEVFDDWKAAQAFLAAQYKAGRYPWRSKNPSKISLIAPKRKPAKPRKNPAPKTRGIKGLKNFIVQMDAGQGWETDDIFSDKASALLHAGALHKQFPHLKIQVLMDKG